MIINISIIILASLSPTIGNYYIDQPNILNAYCYTSLYAIVLTVLPLCPLKVEPNSYMDCVYITAIPHSLITYFTEIYEFLHTA